MLRTRVLDWTQAWPLGWVTHTAQPRQNFRVQAVLAGCPRLLWRPCLFSLQGDNRKITAKTVLFCVPPGSHLSLPFDM